MFKRIAILTAAVTASSVVAVAAATAASATPIGEGFYTNSSTCTQRLPRPPGAGTLLGMPPVLPERPVRIRTLRELLILAMSVTGLSGGPS